MTSLHASPDNICAIVLDYRGADKTRKCLLSLVGQGLKTAYVLDNSASHTSSAELRQTIERVRLTKPGFVIEILSAGKNLGFGRGVNFVLSYDRRSGSPHDHYLLLNNDAIARPGLVSGLITALQQDSCAALAAPRIISHDPGREYGIWYHRYLGLLLSRPGKFRFHYFTGCCLLFRKDLVTSSGIFDESFFMYGEDAELAWRLTRQGRKMVCAEEACVEHEYGPSVDRSSFFYEYHMARGHFLVCFKTYVHPMEIPFLILIKSAAIAMRSLLRALRHRSFTPLKALCCAWFRLKNLNYQVLLNCTTRSERSDLRQFTADE